jgi:hypothetical protein
MTTIFALFAELRVDSDYLVGAYSTKTLAEAAAETEILRRYRTYIAEIEIDAAPASKSPWWPGNRDRGAW